MRFVNLRVLSRFISLKLDVDKAVFVPKMHQWSKWYNEKLKFCQNGVGVSLFVLNEKLLLAFPSAQVTNGPGGLLQPEGNAAKMSPSRYCREAILYRVRFVKYQSKNAFLSSRHLHITSG